MNSLLLFLGLVLLAYKALDTKTALQILFALYLAFLVRRVIQFFALLKTIKKIKCDYYLLTPWRSTLWLILPHIKYITPPVSVPVNDAVKLRQRYEQAGGARIVGLATVFSPQVTLYIADSKAIKAIVADRAAFPKPLELYRALAPYGENITITGGDEWRRHRRIVGPAFCEETYALGWENSVSITKDWLRHLDERIRTEASKEGLVIEKGFKQTSLQLALGVFTTTAFGYPISTPGQKADPVPPGHQYTLKDTLEGAVNYMNLFTTVATPSWLSWFPYGKIRRAMDLKKELDMWLGEIIEERKKALQMGEEKKDLLYNLIKANELEREQQEKEGLERSSAQALTPQELNGNLFIFLLAGHETAAHTLAFAFGLLALFPDEQEKLYEEIMSLHSDKDIDIPYTDMPLHTRALAIIYETLRLYPAVMSVPKMVTPERDVAIPISDCGPGGEGQLVIPREALIGVDVQSLHHDPVYWPEPEEFKPERFIDTNEYKWDRDSFMPFSAGARACIGRKFSEVEMVAILITFCREYRVVLPQSMQGPPGETSLEKRNRVLRNKSLVTLVPLNLDLAFQRR